jgi:hypothetical protein
MEVLYQLSYLGGTLDLSGSPAILEGRFGVSILVKLPIEDRGCEFECVDVG